MLEFHHRSSSDSSTLFFFFPLKSTQKFGIVRTNNEQILSSQFINLLIICQQSFFARLFSSSWALLFNSWSLQISRPVTSWTSLRKDPSATSWRRCTSSSPTRAGGDSTWPRPPRKTRTSKCAKWWEREKMDDTLSDGWNSFWCYNVDDLKTKRHLNALYRLVTRQQIF